VKEDGKEQPIKSFEEFGTQAVQPPARPPNDYTNVQPPAASAATNILWFDFTNAAPRLSVACCIPPGNTSAGLDDLARSLGWQHHAKQYAKEYLKKMPTGTRVAVFGTWFPRGLHVLQGVTSDPALLTAAIDAIPYDTDATPVKPDVMTEIGPQQENRNRATLAALDQIASDLATIKGRKNLIWYTARISTLPLPLQTQALKLDDPLPALQRAYGLLAAAQVTVFPVSITGLEQPDGPSGLLALEAVAESTGGKAYYNNNDLGDLTAKAIDSGSDYYTLSYVPPGSEYDGRHHSIKVVADKPGLKLTYRDEYYAEDPKGLAAAAFVNLGKVTPMQAALDLGVLNATEIPFRVHVTESPVSATPAADNQPNPKQMKPPYRHYSISYLIDVHGINFTPGADRNYRGKFEYGVRVYNVEGDVINSTANSVSPIVPPVVYQSMLRTGANAHRDIDVPATGDYFLRIAVHDLTSDRVGSIEIPTSSLAPAKSEKP
jgi:VWFA-related protein